MEIIGNVDQDPMTALLLRPHLWNGRKDPYLYQVRAWLRFPTGIDSSLFKTEDSGKFRDSEDFENRREVYWQRDLAIYDLRVIEKKRHLFERSRISSTHRRIPAATATQ